MNNRLLIARLLKFCFPKKGRPGFNKNYAYVYYSFLFKRIKILNIKKNC